MEAEREGYLQHLPKGQAELTDCVLVSQEGAELVCHSLLLYSISPVLVGVHDTARGSGKHRIPVDADADALRAFLTWLYERKLPVADAALEKQLDVAAKLSIQGAPTFAHKARKESATAALTMSAL